MEDGKPAGSIGRAAAGARRVAQPARKAAPGVRDQETQERGIRDQETGILRLSPANVDGSLPGRTVPSRPDHSKADHFQ